MGGNASKTLWPANGLLICLAGLKIDNVGSHNDPPGIKNQTNSQRIDTHTVTFDRIEITTSRHITLARRLGLHRIRENFAVVRRKLF